MTYESIPGWFDYHDVYSDLCAVSRDDFTIVEVGVWEGKSLVFLADLLKQAGKHPRLFALDNFAGSECDRLNETCREMAASGRPLLDRFRANVEACGVADMITVVVSDSAAGASLFEPASCDFVFIDADHSYAAVHQDITCWLPRIRPGGILAGHDYERDTVRRAVHELIGEEHIRKSQMQNTWIYEVPEETDDLRAVR